MNLDREINKKRQELRKLELMKLYEEDKYKQSMLIQSTLHRCRFLFELQELNKHEIVLNTKDFKIVDKFCDTAKIPVGRGLRRYFEFFLNYYKNEVSNN